MRPGSQKGFTLMETFIVIAVLVVVLIGLFTLYSLHLNIYNSQQAQIAATSSARDAMREMENYILPASGVMNTQTFSGTTYTTGPQTLILEIPSMDSSGNALGNTWDYAVFYLNGGSLYERTLPSASSVRPARFRQLSDAVSQLTFTYNNSNYTSASSVTADLLVRKTVRGQNFDSHLNQQWFLRNQ